VGSGANFLWVKRAEREVGLCPPLVKVKIDYSCTFAAPVCVHGMARDKFSFIFEMFYAVDLCYLQ
jgi:hypothetical protein